MSRTFALSDIHGQRALWEQIKDYLNPDDTLYFLGDAIDRGPHGFAIMKELLTDKRVTYLKGNHEYMMEKALREEKQGDILGEEMMLWSYNGCLPTYQEWKKSGSHYSWIRFIANLPVKVIYNNQKGEEVILTHAGFTPGREEPSEYDLVWSRSHFFTPITNEKQIVVHGHTPNEYLIEELKSWEDRQYFQERDGAVVYCDGQKVDIDCGSFYTGHAVLLDLDTWRTIPFDAEIEE